VIRSWLYHFFLFSFTDTSTTDLYTLSLHDALPIFHHFANAGSIHHRRYPDKDVLQSVLPVEQGGNGQHRILIVENGAGQTGQPHRNGVIRGSLPFDDMVSRIPHLEKNLIQFLLAGTDSPFQKIRNGTDTDAGMAPDGQFRVSMFPDDVRMHVLRIDPIRLTELVSQ